MSKKLAESDGGRLPSPFAYLVHGCTNPMTKNFTARHTNDTVARTNLLCQNPLHPHHCGRDVYAILNHLPGDLVSGRRLRHRPSTPNDLKRGFLRYQQSTTQPVRLCFDVTILYATPSTINCRYRSILKETTCVSPPKPLDSNLIRNQSAANVMLRMGENLRCCWVTRLFDICT